MRKGFSFSTPASFKGLRISGIVVKLCHLCRSVIVLKTSKVFEKSLLNVVLYFSGLNYSDVR